MPVARNAVWLRLAGGIGVGAAVSLVAMWLWLGIRPDLASAAMTSPYWVKFFYTLVLAVSGIWAMERLSRPGGNASVPLIAMAVAFAALLMMASMQIMR